MVDGRLLAAFRALHAEAAVAAAQAQAQQAAGSQQEKQGQGGGGALGATWEQHLRLALVRRCREILASMPTPLLDDLRRLAAWEQASGQAQHCWAQALQHYSPALAAWEAKHGSLAAGAPPASAGGAGEQAGSGGDVGSGSAAPVLDAGAAGEDAALARLLLQQAQAQSEAEAVQEEGAAGGGPSILPVIYRCYKKLVLADAILLSS